MPMCDCVDLRSQWIHRASRSVIVITPHLPQSSVLDTLLTRLGLLLKPQLVSALSCFPQSSRYLHSHLVPLRSYRCDPGSLQAQHLFSDGEPYDWRPFLPFTPVSLYLIID